MSASSDALTLLARQTRMINAAEGFLLEVQCGCLWLTRPGDTADHFLVAGASIELHQSQVLIQSDRHPGTTGQVAARYRLTPLQPAGLTLRAFCVASLARARSLVSEGRPKSATGGVAIR